MPCFGCVNLHCPTLVRRNCAATPFAGAPLPVTAAYLTMPSQAMLRDAGSNSGAEGWASRAFLSEGWRRFAERAFEALRDGARAAASMAGEEIGEAEAARQAVESFQAQTLVAATGGMPAAAFHGAMALGGLVAVDGGVRTAAALEALLGILRDSESDWARAGAAAGLGSAARGLRAAAPALFERAVGALLSVLLQERIGTPVPAWVQFAAATALGCAIGREPQWGSQNGSDGMQPCPKALLRRIVSALLLRVVAPAARAQLAPAANLGTIEVECTEVRLACTPCMCPYSEIILSRPAWLTRLSPHAWCLRPGHIKHVLHFERPHTPSCCLSACLSPARGRGAQRCCTRRIMRQRGTGCTAWPCSNCSAAGARGRAIVAALDLRLGFAPCAHWLHGTVASDRRCLHAARNELCCSVCQQRHRTRGRIAGTARVAAVVRAANRRSRRGCGQCCTGAGRDVLSAAAWYCTRCTGVAVAGDASGGALLQCGRAIAPAAILPLGRTHTCGPRRKCCRIGTAVRRGGFFTCLTSPERHRIHETLPNLTWSCVHITGRTANEHFTL